MGKFVTDTVAVVEIWDLAHVWSESKQLSKTDAFAKFRKHSSQSNLM